MKDLVLGTVLQGVRSIEEITVGLLYDGELQEKVTAEAFHQAGQVLGLEHSTRTLYCTNQAEPTAVYILHRCRVRQKPSSWSKLDMASSLCQKFLCLYALVLTVSMRRFCVCRPC